MIKIALALFAGIGAAAAASTWGHFSSLASLGCGVAVTLVGVFASDK